MLKEISVKVAEVIEKRGIKAIPTQTEKNGVPFYGITLGEGNVRPNIYLNEENIEMDIEDIADGIIETYNNAPNMEEEYEKLASEFGMWLAVKDRIRPCIMKPLIDDYVTRPCLDLNIYYRAFVAPDASIVVKKNHLEVWGVTEQDLFETAMNNGKDTFVCRKLSELLNEEMGVEIPDEPMWVATNEQRVFGASAMLNLDLLKNVADQIDNDLVIIPSSVHECLLMDASAMDASYVNTMIKSVNDETVAPTDVLSNHAYYYSREDNTVSIYE